jgi:hypothetical protein
LSTDKLPPQRRAQLQLRSGKLISQVCTRHASTRKQTTASIASRTTMVKTQQARAGFWMITSRRRKVLVCHTASIRASLDHHNWQTHRVVLSPRVARCSSSIPMVLMDGVCNLSVLAQTKHFVRQPLQHSMICALKASQGIAARMDNRASWYESDRLSTVREHVRWADLVHNTSMLRWLRVYDALMRPTCDRFHPRGTHASVSG